MPVAQLLFSDAFTDADGTLLTAHTPDVAGGASWAKNCGSNFGGDLQILGNQVARSQSVTTQPCIYLSGLTLPGTGGSAVNYDLLFDLKYFTANNNNPSIYVCGSTSAVTGYVVDYTGQSQWRVRRFSTGNSAGTIANSISSLPPAVYANATSKVRVNVGITGGTTTITVFVDGLWVLNCADTTLASTTAPGVVGLLSTSTIAESGAVGLRWDNFQVWSNYVPPLTERRVITNGQSAASTVGLNGDNISDVTGSVPSSSYRIPSLTATTNYLLLFFERRYGGIQDYFPADVNVYRVPRANIVTGTVTRAAVTTAVPTYYAPKTFTISNVALTSNVATVTTSAAHGYVTGQAVSIYGCSNTVFNSPGNTQSGNFLTLTGVPTSTTFTFSKTNADIASAAATGTVTSFAGGPGYYSPCAAVNAAGTLVCLVIGYPAKGGTGMTNTDTWNGATIGTGNTGNTAIPYVMTSTDEGATWSAPAVLNKPGGGLTKPSSNGNFGFGPGSMVVIPPGRNGANATYGRLVAPLQYSTNGLGTGPFHAAACYSDDGGATWSIGSDICDGTAFSSAEAAMTLLSDGRLLWSGRPTGGSSIVASPNRKRFLSWSSDNGATWTTPVNATGGSGLLDPVCQAGLMTLPGGQVVASHPYNGASTRQDGVVQMSADGGLTWSDPATPATSWPLGTHLRDPATTPVPTFAYSSMVAADGWLYVFFEEGANAYGTLARVSPSWLGVASAVAAGPFTFNCFSPFSPFTPFALMGGG